MVRAGGRAARGGRMPGPARELNGKISVPPCPKCDGYLGIVVTERKAKTPLQAIDGRCLKCGYRLAWVLVLGKCPTRHSA